MNEARARRLYPRYEAAVTALLEARGFVRQPDQGSRSVKHRLWRKEEGFRAEVFRLTTRAGDLLHVWPHFALELLVPGRRPILLDERPTYFLASGRHAQYALPLRLALRSDDAVLQALVDELDAGFAWMAGMRTREQIQEALASRDRNGVTVGSPAHQAALEFLGGVGD